MMIITKKAIGRRTMLRGVGTALALPFLDGMAPALSAAAKPVNRFGAVYVPNGIMMQNWTPATEGAAFRIVAHSAAAGAVSGSSSGAERAQ